MPDRDDYSVTWDEIKPLVDDELARRGKSKNDKIPFGLIECILEKIWQEIFWGKYKNSEGR